MKRFPVVKVEHLPVRSPLLLTLVTWLMLDRLSPSGWVVGVVATLVVLVWAGFFIRLWHEDAMPVPGFDGGE